MPDQDKEAILCSLEFVDSFFYRKNRWNVQGSLLSLQNGLFQLTA